ncbi:MAG: CHAT domain-containing protein [Thermoguttaceae bacterium]|nr:CHAT domain-containing protein [Thermoguttaceae bacterium]MDW8038280.1 CHAT domain-containing tetratricopeptide repeat protein [Thermoguttaceae bacterium]
MSFWVCRPLPRRSWCRIQVVFVLLQCLLVLLSPKPLRAEETEAQLLQQFQQIQAQCEELIRGGKYSEAEPIAQELLQLANGPLRTLPLNRAIVYSLLGKIYYHQARYAEAERVFQQAINIYEDKLGLYHPQTATVINDLAVLLQAQGRYAQAEPLYQQALRIRRKTLLRGDPAIGTTLNDLALLYWQQARYEQAEPLYLEALGIYQSAFGEAHAQIATVLNNLGELYRHWGRFHLADSYHQKALQMRAALWGWDHLEVADSLANIAQLDIAQGRYAQAENHLRRALTIRQTCLGGSHASVASCQANLAALYLMQHRLTEAGQLYRQAQEILQHTLQPDHPTLAALQMGLGHVYLSQADYPQAEAHYQNALQIRQKAFGPEHPLVADCLASLAMVAKNCSRFAEAETRWKQALEQHRRFYGSPHPAVARDLYGLAQVALAQQDLRRAESLLLQAEQILQQTYCEGQLLARVYADRAQILWKNQRPLEALWAVEQAFQRLERQRIHIAGGEWERGEFFGRWSALFEQMIHWQAQLGLLPELFTTMERSRARSLLEHMELTGLDLLAGLPETEAQPLRQRESQLAAQLASLQHQWELLRSRTDLSPTQKAPQETQVLEAIRAAQADYTQAYAALRNASPTYRLVLEEGQKPVAWKRLKTWIKDHKMLFLEYFLGQQASYVLAVHPTGQVELAPLELSPEQAQALKLPAGPLTASKVAKLMIQEEGTGLLELLGTSMNETQEAKAAQYLAILWEVLIPPKCREGLLNGDYQLLGVVPDGTLVWLPWETLVVAQGPPPKYLLDVGPPILYGPSATVLVKLAHRKAQRVQPASEPVLAVGDCIYQFWPVWPPAQNGMASRESGTSNSSAVPTDGQTASPVAYASLRYSAEEIRFVAEVFGKQGISVRSLSRHEATEANLRQLAPGRRIIDLACHGRVDPALGHFWGAFLALTPGSQQDSSDDGFLTVQESCQLNLAGCELAILAACQTNLGKQQPGEGVWSLARGFLVAGARRVVAGNWLLDDLAAASTVSYFCAILAQQEAALIEAHRTAAQAQPTNPPPPPPQAVNYAQALHQAKRWVRSQRQWRTPYFWAPLILIGPP